MHQSPAQLLKKYLNEKDISPREFSQLSGMPETEIQGIMEGELPITSLRAHHLAIALNTEVEMWLKGDRSQKNRRPKQPSLLGCD